jgi:hypothetical protein
MRQIVIAVFTVQGVLAVPYAARGQSAAAPGMIRVSLEKGRITQHEPVIADIAVDNPSLFPVQFDPGYNMQQISLHVVDQSGRRLEAAAPPDREGMKFSNAVQVGPGTTHVIPILLNRWFDPEAVGNYSIDLAIRLPRSGSNGEISYSRSKLELTVLPEDKKSLESACIGLLARIENSHSAYDAIIGAEALASVEDPAAVPFVAEAMKKREFTAMMVGALARIRTDEAISALVTASRSSDDETRGLARAALAALGKSGAQ